MGSLTGCIRKAGDFLSAADRAAIHKRAGELRAGGAKAAEAGRQSVAEVLASKKSGLQEIEAAQLNGVTLYEAPPPQTPAHQAEQEAAGSRVDQIVRDMPGLKVQLDDMPEAMTAADFMAAVKAEADDMAADAPLMQVAAECALLNGAAG